MQVLPPDEKTLSIGNNMMGGNIWAPSIPKMPITPKLLTFIPRVLDVSKP